MPRWGGFSVGGGIFVSYRREDSQHAAGRLVDHLTKTFDRDQLFLDVDAIEPGLDFVKVFLEKLASCDVLLAVIGKHWLELKNPDGQRRLDDPRDFVRIEIEEALKRNDMRVIPVLVDGARMPKPEDLPESLRPLARRMATQLTHEKFNVNAEGLVDTLRTIVPTEPSGKHQVATPAQPREARRRTQPGGPARLTHDAAPAARASIGESLDSFFARQSPMTVWGLPVIIGMLVIWTSSFFGIDAIRAPALNPDGLLKECSSSGKQVGMWTAPNWSIVYLVLFPAYLILISFLARLMRTTLDELTVNGVLIHSDGSRPNPQAVHRELNNELRGNRGLFVTLALVVVVISLGGWWISAGQPLLNFRLENNVVDWGTIVVACKFSHLQYWVFFYTLGAYIWMGAALFAFLSCLFLGFIYSSFLSKLAFSGQQQSSDGPSYRLLPRGKILTQHLRDFLAAYFIACVLGLLAGYFMRLQAGYLFSSYEDLLGYWFQDFQWLANLLGSNYFDSETTSVFQRAGAKSQTRFTALLITAVTTISLVGTGWMIYRTFRDSKSYATTGIASPEETMPPQLKELTPKERERVQAVQFLPAVIPAAGPMGVIIFILLLGTLYSNFGFLVAVVSTLSLAKILAGANLRALRDRIEDVA
jgi:hypothetical protein